MTIKIGDIVPELKFHMTNGQIHQFADFRGQKIVLYFYPKDDTPGCTLEAQGFRDHMQDFAAKNTLVLGVSKDNEKSHQKFREKYCLPFDLIMDTQGELAEAFGVWKEKSMYGKKYMGIERSTFLIDETGRLQKEWRKVSVPGHVAAVLESL